MNKNDFELEKLKISAERFHHVMDTVAKLLMICGWVGAVYLVMRSMESMVLAKPEAIQALALVVEKLRKRLEANDLHRGTSGLDDNGHTPK